MIAREYASIDVTYRYIDGYHVLTSDDVYGLYVASKDQHLAFDTGSRKF